MLSIIIIYIYIYYNIIKILNKADKLMLYCKRSKDGNKMIIPSHRKLVFDVNVRASGSENGVAVAFISLHLLPLCVFNANVFDSMVYSCVGRERQKQR